LISAVVHYFTGGLESDAASAIGFIISKNGAVSIISFVRLAPSECDIDLIVNDFLTLIIKWLACLSNVG